MTMMLASVSGVEEAATILGAGPDIIDIKDPHRGALGAVDPVIARAIVKQINGQKPTSATIGDLPMRARDIADAISNMQATGVDIVKVGVFAQTVPADVLRVIKSHAQNGVKIVMVFFADLGPALDDFSYVANAGVHGVMLDTADKTKGSLRTILEDYELANFVRQARYHGLISGLAGSLQLTDIPPLLKLEPDYLGFRSALCKKQQRTGVVDLHAALDVRSLIYAERVNGDVASTLTLTM